MVARVAPRGAAAGSGLFASILRRSWPGPTPPSSTVSKRDVDGSRATRRLRRDGLVPGVVYGGGEEPVPSSVDARELRLALAHGGAVLDLAVDGGTATPVVVKDSSATRSRGETIHVDLLRVRLDVAIQATVPLELLGAEDAPGVKEGGVLEHVTRELNVEALPNDIPDVDRARRLRAWR